MELTKQQLLGFYQTMSTIRTFENKTVDLFAAGKVPGFVHLYIGEEAIATGLLSELNQDDYVASTHRGHGHCIAKGAKIKPMRRAEAFPTAEPRSRAKRGARTVRAGS